MTNHNTVLSRYDRDRLYVLRYGGIGFAIIEDCVDALVESHEEL